MEDSLILARANEVIKGANFTGFKKPRKNAGAMFLIVAFGNGLGLYGSYASETYYASVDSRLLQLL